MSNNFTNHTSKRTFVVAIGTLGLFAAFTAAISIYSLNNEPQLLSMVEASPDAQSMQLLVSGAETGDMVMPTTRTISLRYLGMNAPIDADIAIVSSDLEQTLTHSTSKVNLRQRGSYSLELAVPAGAYAAVIFAPGIRTKVMPFIVEDSQELIPVNLGSFEPSDSVS
ncbi:hypothetical protein KKE14_00455 [Patescibacteria group bacterium]|nr:hypothetical protein [Patescibacteria group bacterium]